MDRIVLLFMCPCAIIQFLDHRKGRWSSAKKIVAATIFDSALLNTTKRQEEFQSEIYIKTGILHKNILLLHVWTRGRYKRVTPRQGRCAIDGDKCFSIRSIEIPL
jgi:hypothetical protein